jgi:hypothetical protein
MLLEALRERLALTTSNPDALVTRAGAQERFVNIESG